MNVKLNVLDFIKSGGGLREGNLVQLPESKESYGHFRLADNSTTD